MYLGAIMDWWSRLVVGWHVANTMESELCVETLKISLKRMGAPPHIFNTDQGAQFTSEVFTGALKSRGIAISMDGRGRALDNVFIERLWRSLKYEDIYLKEYAQVEELKQGVGAWLRDDNRQRPHQALGYATPWEVHYEPEKHGGQAAPWWQEGELVS